MLPLMRLISGALPVWILPVAAGVAVLGVILWTADRNVRAGFDEIRTTAEREAEARAEADRMAQERDGAIETLARTLQAAEAAAAAIERERATSDRLEAELRRVRAGLAVQPPNPKPDDPWTLQPRHRDALRRAHCLLAAKAGDDHQDGGCPDADGPGPAGRADALPAAPPIERLSVE